MINGKIDRKIDGRIDGRINGKDSRKFRCKVAADRGHRKRWGLHSSAPGFTRNSLQLRATPDFVPS
jgi:hypothetical protein